MKVVILTIGPRGAGKSTFCKEILEADPTLTLIERDAVLVELFGSAELSPYEGKHERGLAETMKRLENALRADPARVILDTWNGSAREREFLIKAIRYLGAEYVIGWHFTTDEDIVIGQFVARGLGNMPAGKERRDRARHLANNGQVDYRLYHSQPVRLDQGFDKIHEIDPYGRNVPPLTSLFS